MKKLSLVSVGEATTFTYVSEYTAWVHCPSTLPEYTVTPNVFIQNELITHTQVKVHTWDETSFTLIKLHQLSREYFLALQCRSIQPCIIANHTPGHARYFYDYFRDPGQGQTYEKSIIGLLGLKNIHTFREKCAQSTLRLKYRNIWREKQAQRPAWIKIH